MSCTISQLWSWNDGIPDSSTRAVVSAGPSISSHWWIGACYHLPFARLSIVTEVNPLGLRRSDGRDGLTGILAVAIPIPDFAFIDFSAL